MFTNVCGKVFIIWDVPEYYVALPVSSFFAFRSCSVGGGGGPGGRGGRGAIIKRRVTGRGGGVGGVVTLVPVTDPLRSPRCCAVLLCAVHAAGVDVRWRC